MKDKKFIILYFILITIFFCLPVIYGIVSFYENIWIIGIITYFVTSLILAISGNYVGSKIVELIGVCMLLIGASIVATCGFLSSGIMLEKIVVLIIIYILVFIVSIGYLSPIISQLKKE